MSRKYDIIFEIDGDFTIISSILINELVSRGYSCAALGVPNYQDIKFGIKKIEYLDELRKYIPIQINPEGKFVLGCNIKDFIDQTLLSIDKADETSEYLVKIETKDFNTYGATFESGVLYANNVISTFISKVVPILEEQHKYYTLPRAYKKHDSCVIFKTHFYDQKVIRRYRKLFEEINDRFHVVFSIDTTKMSYREIDRLKKLGVPGELHTYNKDAMINFGYPMKSDYYGHTHDPMWVHPDYGTLHYWIKTSGMFEYYWQIEYDVHYEGNWFDILDFYMNWNHDFMGHHIKDWSISDSSWYWWSRYDSKYSLDPKWRTRVLACFSRFSTRLLEAMNLEYRKGLDNTNEACIGYIANAYGYSIGDMAPSYLAYEGSKYSIQDHIEFVRPEDFSDKPKAFAYVKNHIYHPVK